MAEACVQVSDQTLLTPGGKVRVYVSLLEPPFIPTNTEHIKAAVNYALVDVVEFSTVTAVLGGDLLSVRDWYACDGDVLTEISVGTLRTLVAQGLDRVELGAGFRPQVERIETMSWSWELPSPSTTSTVFVVAVAVGLVAVVFLVGKFR